jgi:hypothetical protein
MVQIINYEKRLNSDGEEFNVLVLAGGLEMIKSRSSGRYYATRKESTVSCTMSKDQCKELIGQELPGSIKRVECEGYEITDEKTGEILTVHHRWQYSEETESLEETLFADEVIGAKPASQESVL